MWTFLFSLDELREAGLAPDWQTVYVGWRGPFPENDSWRAESLSVESVQQYAAECLTGDPDADYPLVRIMDAGSTSQELEREDEYLRELAACSGGDENTARRKWRYVDSLRVPLKMPYTSETAESDDEDERVWAWKSTIYDFWCTWENRELDHPLPHWDIVGDVEEAVALLQTWITEEKAALNGIV